VGEKMRELTFFTSNAAKLAHARYIAEGRHIRIKGFRQRTYHANYNEPRLSSRGPLLDASYRSALQQCAKAGISVETHPFVLEDTSVRIDALSGGSADFPGLDVKFWMQEQTFSALDSSLRSAGNVRTATVRSDVLLHVPNLLKPAWGISDDYIVFVGKQSGSVTEKEIEFNQIRCSPGLIMNPSTNGSDHAATHYPSEPCVFRMQTELISEETLLENYSRS